MKVTTNNSLLQFIKLVKSVLNGKASSSHTHDDKYYTKNEIDTKLGDIKTALTNLLGV